MTDEKQSRTVFLDETNGDDRNDGSEQSPAKTFHHARRLASGLSPELSADIAVAEHTDEGVVWHTKFRAGEAP